MSFVFVSLLADGMAQFANFPITLSVPFDADTIEDTSPTFVWQCNLSAVQNNPRMSMQYALVALESDQTAAEAISSNPAISLVNGLLASSYSYPSTLQELEKGKTYVWQVQLLYNDQVVQESEPWKFTIADPKQPDHQYIMMNSVPDGTFHVLKSSKIWILLKDDYDLEHPNAVVRKPNNETIAVPVHKVFATEEEAEDGLFNENNAYYLCCNLENVKAAKGIYRLEVTSRSGRLYTLNLMLDY